MIIIIIMSRKSTPLSGGIDYLWAVTLRLGLVLDCFTIKETSILYSLSLSIKISQSAIVFLVEPFTIVKVPLDKANLSIPNSSSTALSCNLSSFYLTLGKHSTLY